MPFLQIIITFGNAAAAHVEESVFIKFSSPPSGLSPTWLGGLSQSPAWCLMCLLLQFQILLKIPFFSNQIMFMFFICLSSPKHPREWVKCKYFEECWNKLNLEGSINSAELGHVKVSSVVPGKDFMHLLPFTVLQWSKLRESTEYRRVQRCFLRHIRCVL